MTKQMFFYFIGLFLLPMLYQRGKFFLFERSFYKIVFRQKSGLQIHHGHFGIVILFVATMLTLFWGLSLLSVSLFGFGWGLLLDEFIPSLLMPSKDRAFELWIYGKSCRTTLVLFLLIAVMVKVLYHSLGKL